MKNTLLSGAAALALVTQIGGATPAVAQQGQEVGGFFSGFYFGGHGVYGGVDFDTLFNNGATGLTLGHDHGLGGGLQAGFNHFFESQFEEIDAFLVSLEGDVTFVTWDDSAVNATPAAVDAQLNLLSSIRLRLGLLFGNFLLYGTGGIAFADWDYSAFDNSSGVGGSKDYFDVGSVVGGGLEFAAFDFAIVRIEGLYYIFGDKHDTSGLVPGSSDPGDFAELENAFAIRAGISIPLNKLFGPFN